jgi:hypothetical protein
MPRQKNAQCPDMASSFVQNPGYLSVPTSIGLMPEALQLTYSTQVAVAAAIRTTGLYAIPDSACRHGKNQPNARCTSNGSRRLSMW